MHTLVHYHVRTHARTHAHAGDEADIIASCFGSQATIMHAHVDKSYQVWVSGVRLRHFVPLLLCITQHRSVPRVHDPASACEALCKAGLHHELHGEAVEGVWRETAAMRAGVHSVYASVLVRACTQGLVCTAYVRAGVGALHA